MDITYLPSIVTEFKGVAYYSLNRSNPFDFDTVSLHTALEKEWDISAHIVANWKMDDAQTDKVVLDSVGSFNGVIEGDTGIQRNTDEISTTGILGGALEMSSESPYNIGRHVKVDTSSFSLASAGITNEITLEGWIKRSILSNTTSFRMFNKGFVFDATLNSFYITVHENRLDLVVSNASNPSTYDFIYKHDINLIDGEWHHIVGTRNATKICLYLDGELLVDDDITGGNLIEQAGYNLRFGYNFYQVGSSPTYHTTQFDNFCIYKKALTADEVRIRYNEGEGTELFSGTNLDHSGDHLVAGDISRITYDSDISKYTAEPFRYWVANQHRHTNNYPPVCPRVSASSDSRLFLADGYELNSEDEWERIRNRVWWSSFLDETLWNGGAYGGSSGYQDVGNNNESVTHIVPFGSITYVFKEKEIYASQAVGYPTYFLFEKINTNIGCVAQRTMVTYENRLIFLGYDCNIYMLEGTTAQPVGNFIQEDLRKEWGLSARNITELYNANKHLAFALLDYEHALYQLYVPIPEYVVSEDETLPQKTVVYTLDLKTGVICKYTTPVIPTSDNQLFLISGIMHHSDTDFYTDNIFGASTKVSLTIPSQIMYLESGGTSDLIGTVVLPIETFWESKLIDVLSLVESRYEEQMEKGILDKIYLKTAEDIPCTITVYSGTNPNDLTETTFVYSNDADEYLTGRAIGRYFKFKINFTDGDVSDIASITLNMTRVGKVNR